MNPTEPGPSSQPQVLVVGAQAVVAILRDKKKFMYFLMFYIFFNIFFL